MSNIPEEIKNKIAQAADEKFPIHSRQFFDDSERSYEDYYKERLEEKNKWIRGAEFGYSLSSVQGWVSVEDKPLVSYDDNKYWTVNEGVPEQFLAAIEVYNTATGKDYWWIRHCIIKDEVGLCVVTDDDEEVAGWEISDVQFYQPLPSPPKTNQ